MYDVGAEAGVIGSLIQRPSLQYLFEKLHPRHFYEKTNAVLYAVILEMLDDNSEDTSEFAMFLRINGNKHYKQVFDNVNVDIQDYISKIKLAGTTDEDEYVSRCKKIIDLAYKRDVGAFLGDLSSQVKQSNLDANTLNRQVVTRLDDFAEDYLAVSTITPFADMVDDLWEEILAGQNKNLGIVGIPSRFKEMNRYFTYERGELIIVGARPKVGKSFFGLNEAWHKVENGVPTAYLDTEMPSRQFFERLLGLVSGVETNKIKTGQLNKDEMVKVQQAMEHIKKQKHFVHIYNPNWTMDDIYLTCRELQRTMGLDFLVYDYIKANEASALEMKEHNHLGDLTNFLKNTIGGQLNIPVLSFVQMAPKEVRVADSDKINRYASVVAYLMKKDSEEMQMDGMDGGNRKFIIDYNRLGEQFEQSGTHINIHFDGSKSIMDTAKKQPNALQEQLFNP